MTKRRLMLSDEVAETRHQLDPDATRYALQALRLADGAAIEVLDSTNRLYAGILEVVSRRKAYVASLEELPLPDQGPPTVLLASLIKGDRWDWLLEKSTELGVSEVIPIQAARCAVTLKADRLASKVERWQRISDSATRQSERGARALVHTPMPLKSALETTELPLFFLDECAPLSAWSSLPDQGMAIALGPEGGWTKDERALLLEHNALPLGLGRNILRAETAALCAMSLVRAKRDALL